MTGLRSRSRIVGFAASVPPVVVREISDDGPRLLDPHGGVRSCPGCRLARHHVMSTRPSTRLQIPGPDDDFGLTNESSIIVVELHRL